MPTTNFFSQFTPEVIKKQYAENAKGLQQMLDKAIKTGKKVSGYTSDQLKEMVAKYNELAK